MSSKIIEMIPKQMEVNSNKLYVFGWPSYLGGADTKLDNTLCLCREFMDITVIPNDCNQLNQKNWVNLYESYGFKCISREDFISLPSKLDGFAISLSNGSFTSGCTLCKLAKSKGLKVLWGNEMMWHFPGELECIKNGLIDAVLYSSKFNREQLEPGYQQVSSTLEGFVVGNYIDPTRYEFRERKNEQFTIGRLSRSDVDKYSADFPIFYESFDLNNPKYRVMGWDHKLKNRYKWHNFGSQWDLLAPEKESVQDFLYSLDVFVYKLGHKFRESWGRSTVEAMLTGCIPVVPTGHNFSEFIIQGKTGFMCETYEDFKNVCKELQNNHNLRKNIARQASKYAAQVICNEERHRKIWKAVFNVK